MCADVTDNQSMTSNLIKLDVCMYRDIDSLESWFKSGLEVIGNRSYLSHPSRAIEELYSTTKKSEVQLRSWEPNKIIICSGLCIKCQLAATALWLLYLQSSWLISQSCSGLQKEFLFVRYEYGKCPGPREISTTNTTLQECRKENFDFNK